MTLKLVKTDLLAGDYKIYKFVDSWKGIDT